MELAAARHGRTRRLDFRAVSTGWVPLSGNSHDYKRHGTSNLFAAFEVATAKVTAAHTKRRRGVEFLDFMDEVVAAYPEQELHVILDNLNTHKNNDAWLEAHLKVTFHFTPTSASWLNQVEIWFSILQKKSLSKASFSSVKQLQEHMAHFIQPTTPTQSPSSGAKPRSAKDCSMDNGPAICDSGY